MITVYKLTTQDNKTRKGEYNECIWGPGVTHSGTGNGGLCGPGYIHAYLSPALAILLNPIHANIYEPRLWECSVSSIAISDKGLKVGAVSLTTLEEVQIPITTTRHRVIFAILCAEAAAEITKPFTVGRSWQIKYRYNMEKFWEWAEDYKQGKSATYAAYAADRAGAYATEAAAVVPRRRDRAASYAARAATYAAEAASYAARAASCSYADAARAATYAAEAASYAAARAAEVATCAAPSVLSFVEIAETAMDYSGF